MLCRMTASAKSLLDRFVALVRPVIGMLILAVILLNIVLGLLNRDPWNLCVAMLFMVIHIGGLLATMSKTPPIINLTMTGTAPDAFEEAFRKHFPPTNKL